MSAKQPASRTGQPDQPDRADGPDADGPTTTDQLTKEVLILTTRTVRAYAVGAAFSIRDVDDTDEFAWRPTDRYWIDVEYRRPRPRPVRQRRTSACSTRVDPSRVRTPDQIRTAGRRVCDG